MTFLENNKRIFEVETKIGFIPTDWEELEVGDQVRIKYKGELQKPTQAYNYQKGKVNYHFAVYIVMTEVYEGQDGIKRIKLKEL